MEFILWIHNLICILYFSLLCNVCYRVMIDHIRRLQCSLILFTCRCRTCCSCWCSVTYWWSSCPPASQASLSTWCGAGLPPSSWKKYDRCSPWNQSRFVPNSSSTSGTSGTVLTLRCTAYWCYVSCYATHYMMMISSSHVWCMQEPSYFTTCDSYKISTAQRILAPRLSWYDAW